MRHRATLLLHVLLSAPVAVLVAASPALSAHAQGPSARMASATGPGPRPYIVVLDAGHGGSPDNAHPEVSYDSGAVATNGLLEKDLTLDMVRRVTPLLQAQGVEVVLTRDTDVNLDITARMQKALDVGADLFLSIHFNGWTDPNAAGSLVLYPKDFCQQFATTMARAMTARLGTYGVMPDGLQFRPEMFQQAAMPTATLEPLFLTNPAEAALIARTDVRDALAHAVVDGIDTQAGDQIATRRAVAATWAVFSRVLGAPVGGQAAAPVALSPATAEPAAATPVPDSITQIASPAPGQTPIAVGVGGAGHSDPAPAVSTGGASAASPASAPAVTGSAPASGFPVTPIALGLVGVALLLLLRRPLLHGLARTASGMMSMVARLEGGELPAIARLDTRGRRRLARRRALLERSRGRPPAERLPLYDELFFRPRSRTTRR